MNAPRVVLVALVLALALLAGSTAQAQDSDAPEGALGHWLPTETWVYEHWLPYDERSGSTRAGTVHAAW